MGKKTKDEITRLKQQIARLERERDSAHLEYGELRKEFIRLYNVTSKIVPHHAVVLEETRTFMNSKWDLEDYQ